MKPVLLAMNNPIRPEPEYALYPYPPNCTGHRVWRMLDEAAQRVGTHVSRSEYLDGFDRINLLNAREWSACDAAARAQEVLPRLADRRVAVLGVATLRALRLPRPTDWLEWGDGGGLRYTLMPHPSGRCREYNDPEFRARVGDAILRLYLSGKE